MMGSYLLGWDNGVLEIGVLVVFFFFFGCHMVRCMSWYHLYLKNIVLCVHPST